MGYSVAEFDTFTRHKVPIIAVTGNDACWTQIAREQVPKFKTSVACDLVHTDYHIVADGYGGKGFKVDDIKDVDATVKEAVKLSREGKAVLLNCLIGKTTFRDGSISV